MPKKSQIVKLSPTKVSRYTVYVLISIQYLKVIDKYITLNTKSLSIALQTFCSRVKIVPSLLNLVCMYKHITHF